MSQKSFRSSSHQFCLTSAEAGQRQVPSSATFIASPTTLLAPWLELARSAANLSAIKSSFSVMPSLLDWITDSRRMANLHCNVAVEEFQFL